MRFLFKILKKVGLVLFHYLCFKDSDEFGLRATKIELLEKNLHILQDEYFYNPNFEVQKLLKNSQTFGDIENGVGNQENKGNSWSLDDEKTKY